MDVTYGKKEKLKSKSTIEQLFAGGNSVAKYPLRIVYIKQPESTGNKVGVSVSKKYFKKAVDRNYFKRLLRETYRLNKHMLSELPHAYAIMIFYQTKDRLDYADINQKMIRLFEKFITAETTSA